MNNNYLLTITQPLTKIDFSTALSTTFWMTARNNRN